MSGTLYLVATPIGNLKDISLRALEILKKVDYILTEDTRVTKKLLERYEIPAKTTSFNEHNQLKKIPKILTDLKKGKAIALVSDAGTPLISDPGGYLVKLAIKEGVAISPLPGPSAVLTALIVSGLSSSPFIFLGYLAKSKIKKERLLKQISKITIARKRPTFIVFESPKRIVETLKILADIDFEVKVCLCREMTKIHEEFIRGNPKEVLKRLSQGEIKGEITLVFQITK